MLLNDLRDRLVAQGVGVYGSNLFLGSKAKIPIGDGPYISLTETGGPEATRIHNKDGANTRRPTAQVLVRAKYYDEARAKIEVVYGSLNGIFNTTLGTTFYQKIIARQEPESIGLDSNERVMLVFNVEAEHS